MAEGELNTQTKDGRKVKGLVTRTCERTKEEFTFFFGQQTVFSQWHPCSFTLDGVQYNCAEQYMMHQKAGECDVWNDWSSVCLQHR